MKSLLALLSSILLLVACGGSSAEPKAPDTPGAAEASPLATTATAAPSASPSISPSVAPAATPLPAAVSADYHPRAGDIVFQVSPSQQSLAIQIATNSPWSHVGLVFIEGDQPMVLEAARDVAPIALIDWIDRGIGGRVVVKRLTDAEELLTAENLDRLREAGRALEGKHYDRFFEWDDETLYCSELVWKVYDRALGVDLSELRKFSEFNLDHPIVRAKIHERWPDGPPLEEPVVSPADLFNSPRLVTVYER